MLRTTMLSSVWLLLASAPAQAAAVSLSVSLEPPIVPFHRTATYTVTLEAPAGLAVSLPEIDLGQDGLEVHPGEQVTEPFGEHGQRVHRSYVLDPVQVRTYLLPSVLVSYGEGESVAAPAIVFQARDLTEEEAAAAGQFSDIIQVESLLPERGRLSWPWLAAIAALLLLAAIAGYIYYKRNRAAVPAPPLPAWEVALQRLRALAQRQLPEQGRYEAFYVDLSAILRYYIEDRFSLHAPEQTTPEFLDAAASLGVFSDEQQRVLASFLRHCDRVKFAQHQPTHEEMERSFKLVRQFVKETIPAPVDSQTTSAVEVAA